MNVYLAFVSVIH